MRYLFLLCFLMPFVLFAQNPATATVSGILSDSDGEKVISATINVQGTTIYTLSNPDGSYKIVVPADRKITLLYSYVGYKSVKKQFIPKPDQFYKMDIVLNPLDGVEVVVKDFINEASMLKVDAEDIEMIPTTTGSLEQIIRYLAPGVSGGPGGELTSQYSVRGGNYDENLVYVNGFEIYRPLLVRSGQQEGLTFPNPDFLKELSFSSGGFKAQYGDKLSSVLDVRYKRPMKFASSISGSLLGAGAHIEGAIIKNKYKNAEIKDSNPERFTYMLGARYKTSQYLLSSLDVKGEYVPQFFDFQADLTYDINKFMQVELLGNYNSNVFNLVPTDRSTVSGLFNLALKLDAVFDGQEVDDFTTWFSGAAITLKPRENVNLRFSGSAYQSFENERFDLLSDYRLDEIETGLGEDSFGEVVGTLGYGTNQMFVRNYLTSTVQNADFKGSWALSKVVDKENNETLINSHFIRFGAKFQHEEIDDQLNEWERLDSLGYTIPYNTQQIEFVNNVKTKINLSSNRYSAFIQDDWNIKDNKKEIRINLGGRVQYWDLNKELIFSPRGQFFYSPYRPLADSINKGLNNITYKLAVGAYFQPPYYRELRDFDGNINTAVKSQKSIHYLSGIAMDFKLFKRRFKFIAEAYYKQLWDIVPYDIENVRIRYYGDNLASGYVAGIDFRVNGEFIKDAESWINLSFLRAREKFNNVDHLKRYLDNNEIVEEKVPDVARPTDQTMILSMFFQDYLRNNKNFKMNLALTVGSGLPFGLPRNNVTFRNTYRFNPYHRIDIGFSYSFWNRARFIKNKGNDAKHALKFMKKAWASIEVFNLMQVANTASNSWVKDFNNVLFAIPNNLTSRRINFRLRVDF